MTSLFEQAWEKENLLQALRQVRRNRGAPGIDGRSVDELSGYLKDHWLGIKDELLHERYRPQAVKRVEIPKPDGRQRKLGIPTVLDRFIQQAINQVLQRVYEPRLLGLEHGQVRARTLASVAEPGADDCAAKPLLYGPGLAYTGSMMKFVPTPRAAVCMTRMYGGGRGVGP